MSKRIHLFVRGQAPQADQTWSNLEYSCGGSKFSAGFSSH